MIRKDTAEATKWLKMAAEHGSAEAKKKLEKLEQQKSLALLKWKENNFHTITIFGVKDKNVEVIYVPNLIDNKKVSTLGFISFGFCISLKKIHLPDSLQFIDRGAFEGCTSLTEIHFPDSLHSIGEYAFEGCTSLTEIHFPDSLQSIGEYAFYDCTSLTEIHLPDSLQAIGDGAFLFCNNLKQVYLSHQNYEKFKDCFPDTTEFIIHD